MELRHGVNCMEPIINKKAQKIEAVFLPCNFKDEQKWKLLSLSESNSVNDGKLSNVASGQCLTFKNKDEKANVSRKNDKKKNKMLSMLTNIVKDSVEKSKSPYLVNCESNNTNIDVLLSQIWLLQ